MTRISEQDMALVIDPATPYESRKAAFFRAVEQAWQEGWDACDEEYRAALLPNGAAQTVRPA